MAESIPCPQCKSKLRLPAEMMGKRVKCPQCGTTFTAGADGASPSSAQPKAGSQVKKPQAPPKKADDEVEVVDEVEDVEEVDDVEDVEVVAEDAPKPPRRKSSRSRDEEDDDEDRPRRKRRRDEDEDDDEDDDRPRRKRRRDEDEDDDNDRPRRRRSRDDEDDEDEDTERRKKRKARARAKAKQWARLGLLLTAIGASLYAGAVGLTFLFRLLQVSGVAVSDDLFIMPGLVGIGNWLVAGVGFGFLIAGPKEKSSFGLAIATMSVAAVHLIFAIVSLTQSSRSMFSMGASGTNWGAMVTQMDYWETLINNIQMASKLASFGSFGGMGSSGGTSTFGLIWLPMLTGLLELARLILAVLLLRALGEGVKDHSLSQQSMIVVIALPTAIVVMMLATFGLFKIRPDSVTTMRVLAFLMLFLVYGTLLAILGFYTYLNFSARSSMDS